MFKTTKKVSFTFILFFVLENIKRLFLLTWKPLNKLGGTFFVLCLLLNTPFLLYFAISLAIASAATIFSHFNLEKHHSYFAFSFLTTFDFLYCLFWGFETPNTEFTNEICYLSISTLSFKKISSTSLFYWLSLNIFFLPFFAIFRLENA